MVLFEFTPIIIYEDKEMHLLYEITALKLQQQSKIVNI